MIAFGASLPKSRIRQPVLTLPALAAEQIPLSNRRHTRRAILKISGCPSPYFAEAAIAQDLRVRAKRHS